MKILINEGTSFETVKEYLRYELKLSSKTVSLLKRRENGILLDGVRVTVAAKLTPPCMLELACEDAPEDENPYLTAENIPLDILYEDPFVIAVNKPPRMPTHQSMGHHSGTLANALAYHCAKEGRSFVFRPINRLDRDTSGVTLCALDRISAAYYASLLANGSFRKTYIAVVSGKTEPNGVIDAPIRRAEGSVLLRETCSRDATGADSALTEFTTLASSSEISVLRVTPHTGRTHQIRVHLASIGHPILGDYLYGTEDRLMPRQALHAFSLTVTDKGKTYAFRAPLPTDMRRCISANLPNFTMEELL